MLAPPQQPLVHSRNENVDPQNTNETWEHLSWNTQTLRCFQENLHSLKGQAFRNKGKLPITFYFMRFFS